MRGVSSLQDTIQLAYKGNTYHLDDILVDKFCPSDLIEPGTAPLLLEQQHNALLLLKGPNVVPLDASSFQVGIFLTGDSVQAVMARSIRRTQCQALNSADACVKVS